MGNIANFNNLSVLTHDVIVLVVVMSGRCGSDGGGQCRLLLRQLRSQLGLQCRVHRRQPTVPAWPHGTRLASRLFAGWRTLLIYTKTIIVNTCKETRVVRFLVK